MFVQVFQGQVSDASQVRDAAEDWLQRLAPGAEGWLGSTMGVTDDGTFVAVARFESAEAARRNSGRAQQGEWWSGVEKLFPQGAVFHDCSQVDYHIWSRCRIESPDVRRVNQVKLSAARNEDFNVFIGL